MTKLIKFINIGMMFTMMAVALLGVAGTAFALPPSQLPIDSSDDLGLQYGKYSGLAQSNLQVTIMAIIRIAMGLLGIVAVCIVLMGGFKWMTAGGNDDQVGEAKKWIFSGIIGLALIISAYAIASFVIESLVTVTKDSSIAV